MLFFFFKHMTGYETRISDWSSDGCSSDLKVQGAHSINNYNQPRRDQRKQVVKAAKEENIAVVAEGASLFGQDITIIQDGNTTLEHNIPQSMLYEDVLSFFSQTGVGYTPTLGVTYGGPEIGRAHV